MKKDKEELELLAFRLEAIVDSLPFSVWLKGVDGKYIYVNKNIEDYTGKAKKEITGKDDYFVYSKEEADVYIASDLATIEGKMQGYYESELTDGTIKEEYKKPIFDESGKLFGIIGFAKDITESKKLNDALIESERSNGVLLSNITGAAYRSVDDSILKMTYISEGCYNLTGYTSEELLNRRPSYYDLIPEEYSYSIFSRSENDSLLNQIYNREYPITTASGKTKWVWEKSLRVYDPVQNLTATEGVILDITEKKLTEKALKQSEQRFKTIFEESPMGIGIFDAASGDVYQVNSRYAEILGRTREEILSLNWRSYSHPDDTEEKNRNVELLNTGVIDSFSMDKRYIRPDKTIVWVCMTVTLFQADNYLKARHLCMIEDITEKREATEEIIYLSYYDQLTGMYNRRFYEEEIKRIDTERNLPISLVMADVNGLKLINDAFGHAVGDQLIMKVAEIIKRECRSDDIIARIGGDEFIILLPKTESVEASKIVERISASISKQRINSIVCSASFGLETKKESTEEIRDICTRAENMMYRYKLSESINMRNETIQVITQTLYENNEKEKRHGQRVSELCELLGGELEMSPDDVSELKTAGLLHDIGKIGIEEELLNKKGELSAEEWTEVKRYPEIGYQILRSVNEFAPIAEYILHHRERIDGKGYPRMLENNEILLQARVISLVDAYDVMTNERSYKKKLSKSEAVLEMEENAGKQFDAHIVKVFIEKVLGAQF